MRKPRQESLWGIPMVVLLALGAYSSSLSSDFGLETSVAAAKAQVASRAKQQEPTEDASSLDAIKEPKLIRGAPPPEDRKPGAVGSALGDDLPGVDLSSALEGTTGQAVTPGDAGRAGGEDGSPRQAP